jgi:DNA-binding MarR family transcriptional regulator
MNIKLPANKGEIQRWNRKLILRTIYENEQISQTDLVRITNLSPGTVSNIIRNLRQEGLIQDIGYKSSRDGRKPLLFRLNPEARMYAV